MTTELTAEIQEYLDSEIKRRIDATVQDRVAEEETKRFRQLRLVVVFIGLIGLGTFGTLANYFIEKAVDARAGQVKETLELSRVNLLALKLSVNKSFSAEDATAVTVLLNLIAQNDVARSSPDLPPTLINVLQAFTDSGQGTRIDQLFEVYKREILTSPVMVETLLHHYGQEVVAYSQITVQDPVTTTHYSEGRRDFGESAFAELERAAHSADVEELALYYRTLIQFRADGEKASAEGDKLLQRAIELRSQDLARYWNEMIMRTKPENWTESSPPLAVEFARLTNAFFRQYSQYLSDLYQVPVSTVKSFADGVAADDVNKVAVLMAKAGKMPRPNT